MPRARDDNKNSVKTAHETDAHTLDGQSQTSPHLERVLFAAFFAPPPPVNKEKLKTAAEQRRSGVSREELRRLSTCPGPFPFPFPPPLPTPTHRKAAEVGGRLAVRSPRSSVELGRAHDLLCPVFFCAASPATPPVVRNTWLGG